MDDEAESIAFSSDLDFESEKSEDSIQAEPEVEQQEQEQEEEEQEEESATIKIDMTKLTRRQRSMYYNEQVDFMDIDSVTAEESKVKNEENALRRSEKARRKKHQNEAKLESTKQATIDKLLNRSVKKKKNSTATESEASKEAHLKEGICRLIDSARMPNSLLIFHANDANINQLFKSKPQPKRSPCVTCKGISKFATRTGARVCSLRCMP